MSLVLPTYVRISKADFEAAGQRLVTSNGLLVGVYARSDPPPSAGLTVETTAPVEREMRELNRRFENGGQWTCSGAENLLQWPQIYSHDSKR